MGYQYEKEPRGKIVTWCSIFGIFELLTFLVVDSDRFSTEDFRMISWMSMSLLSIIFAKKISDWAFKDH